MMEPSSNSTLVPCEARWVAGIKGKKKRLLDPEGYVMQYIKTDGARKFFKCSEHAEGCGVRVSVLWETNVICRHNGQHHSHDNMLLEREVKQLVNAAVEEAGSNLTLTARAVHQNVVAKSMEKTGNQTFLSLIPSQKAIQQKIYSKRKKDNNFPSIPKDWEFEIPPEFKVTLDGLPFMIADHTIPGRSGRVLGFSSPSGIALMESAPFLSGDGTFEITASTRFAQCWIIMTKVEKSAVPVAFFLLPSKEQLCYKVMFEALREASVDINPAYWLLDYEVGTINALREVFGNQVVVNGCLVHWKRTVRRKVQELGLVEVINHNSVVAKWVRSWSVLQLVPIGDIPKVSEVIENHTPYDDGGDEDDDDEEEEDDHQLARRQGFNEVLDDLKHYFEKTWTGPKQTTRAGGRRKPRYDPKIWSVRDAIINADEFTTNISESFNSANKLSTVARPSVWALMSMIQKEESSARAKVAAIRSGHYKDSNPGRTKRREEKAERLRELVMSYETMTIEDFIDASLAFYNEFSN